LNIRLWLVWFVQGDIPFDLCCRRISILAFHEALARQPRDPLVVATFALAFYLGGNMSLAVDIGKSITRQHDASFQELLEPQVWNDKHLIAEVQGFAALMKRVLTEMTDEYHVSNAMAKIPQAPSSDVVSTIDLCLCFYVRYFLQRLLRCAFHIKTNLDKVLPVG
jgi:hypothetical protein